MTIKQARQLLGKGSGKMTDEEIQSLVGGLYVLAEIICDQVKIKGSNKQLGVIDSKTKEVQDGIS